MNVRKRGIACILCFAMLVSLLPMPVVKAEGSTYAEEEWSDWLVFREPTLEEAGELAGIL